MKYLLHADGKLPNFALMRLAAYYRARGERVKVVRGGRGRVVTETVPALGDVYGSSIFDFAAPMRKRLEDLWGPVVWGGTGVDVRSDLASIDGGVDWDGVRPDYHDYPEYRPSLGFTTRGCRLRCKWCVVPDKEGKPRAVASIADIYRGGAHPKQIVLLDNDAFAPALADHWRRVVTELHLGGYKVCFSQGLNIRLINEESAGVIATLDYRDNEFKQRRLYTAWDNLGDEAIFRRGVAMLGAAGVPPRHLMVYMLVGYRAGETWDEMMYRFSNLVALGCLPYPMVYDRKARPDLCAFQRWAVTGLYRSVPWEQYTRNHKSERYVSFNDLRNAATRPS